MEHEAPGIRRGDGLAVCADLSDFFGWAALRREQSEHSRTGWSLCASVVIPGLLARGPVCISQDPPNPIAWLGYHSARVRTGNGLRSLLHPRKAETCLRLATGPAALLPALARLSLATR